MTLQDTKEIQPTKTNKPKFRHQKLCILRVRIWEEMFYHCAKISLTVTLRGQ